MSSSSRLAPARRRARTVKVASAGAAMVGFGLVALIARSGHTTAATGRQAVHETGSGLALSTRIGEEATQGTSFFQSGSVDSSQAGSQPQASTRTS